jgi:hypothetical protein
MQIIEEGDLMSVRFEDADPVLVPQALTQIDDAPADSVHGRDRAVHDRQYGTMRRIKP